MTDEQTPSERLSSDATELNRQSSDAPEFGFPRYDGPVTERSRAKIAYTLKLWYGGNTAKGELLKYLPPTREIGELLGVVMRKALPSFARQMAIIQDQWPAIAGEAAAKHSRPVKLYQKALLIEISHPAYQTAFRSPLIRDAIIRKVCEVVGEDGCCEKLTLLASGGRIRPPGS